MSSFSATIPNLWTIPIGRANANAKIHIHKITILENNLVGLRRRGYIIARYLKESKSNFVYICMVIKIYKHYIEYILHLKILTAKHNHHEKSFRKHLL